MINLKLIFAFGAGVIAGTAISSYFIKSKIQEAADEETKAFMDHYNVKLAALRGEIDDDISKDEETNEEDSAETPEEYEEYRPSTEKAGEETYTDYTAVYSGENDGEPSSKDDGIELIDLYIYENDDKFNKETLYYYDINDCLTTEVGEYIFPEDVESYVGYKGLEVLTGGTNEVIYIRNYNKKTDYGVQRLYSSYDGMS